MVCRKNRRSKATHMRREIKKIYAGCQTKVSQFPNVLTINPLIRNEGGLRCPQVKGEKNLPVCQKHYVL